MKPDNFFFVYRNAMEIFEGLCYLRKKLMIYKVLEYFFLNIL